MNKKDITNVLDMQFDIKNISREGGNVNLKIKNLKKHLSFISDIVLKSDYSKIATINKSYDSFFAIFKKITLIGKEKIVLNKLLNNKSNNNKLLIKTTVYFYKRNIDIFYNIYFNEDYPHPVVLLKKVHKVKQNKIFSEYNNIDIAEEYLNNTYKVSENFRDKFVNMNIDKQDFIDFIKNSSVTPYYQNQIKKNIPDCNIDHIIFTDMIFKYKNNRVLLEFIKMLFEREYSAVFGFNVTGSHIISRYNSFKSQNIILDNIFQNHG
jgi:hypothetical protein